MSSDDSYIGNNPASSANSKLFFHQYLIYDNLNWTASGNVCYDATTQSFYVVPFPQASAQIGQGSEVLAPTNAPVLSRANPPSLGGLKKK